MKKLFILLLMPIIVFSQTKESNYVGGSHGYLVVMSGYNLVDVMPKFNAYLTVWKDYTTSDFNTKSSPKENRISASSYKKKMGKGYLNVSYYGSVKEDKAIVDKCIITGTWDEVAYLFVQYWETKMNINELKKGTITKYTISDKIIFNGNLSKGTATIVVEKN